MRARAPGKLVLSGAYAVLRGAPALVLAVDRYVIADASRPADYRAAEVLAAVELGLLPAPVWYDASALREEQVSPAGGPPRSRKLGLGSSAAIVSASLGACRLAAGEPAPGLGARVFPDALRAHRHAQPRGSGIDVAASCFGGLVECRLDVHQPERPLAVTPRSLLPELVIEVFASEISTATAGMLAAVETLEQRQPARVEAIFARAMHGSEQAALATDVASLLSALREQYHALGELGAAAGVAIISAATAALDALAAPQGASFGPSGAGGGDVALYLGRAPSSPSFRQRANQLGLVPLPLRVAAAGLQACP